MHSMLTWIEHTWLSTAIREGGLPYPIIGGIHLLAIALFGGTLLMADLRLLGWAMQTYRFSEVWRRFLPWKRLGFVVVSATGFLLAWAEPIALWSSPSFWIKMALFGLVGVHAMVFREPVYRYPERLDTAITPRARTAAALSLVLWAGLILSGRFIAFDESFDRTGYIIPAPAATATPIPAPR
jgi:uncharacterized protein DUF6644